MIINLDKLNEATELNKEFFKKYSPKVVVVLKTFQTIVVEGQVYKEEDYHKALYILQEALSQTNCYTGKTKFPKINECSEFIERLWKITFNTKVHLTRYKNG